MQMSHFDMNQLEDYNPDTNSLVFTLHNNYRIEIRGDDCEK